MAFKPNPLSLSVPDPAFETWLRDTGYLEIVDSNSSLPDPSSPPLTTTATTKTTTTILDVLKTIASILTLNPFAKLTPNDFSSRTPSWTQEFFAAVPDYSFPSSPSQLRMRIQENVRRYARNYAFLGVLVFAYSLYKRPVSLAGLVVSLLVWELVKYCSSKWELEERFPGLRLLLVRIAQFATATVLYLCNLQLTVFYAIGVSYAVMLLHASLRKLAPSKQSSGSSLQRKSHQQKLQFLIKSR